MVQSFGDYHKIDPKAFSDTGALDPILGLDTLLFIDPSLLRGATTPEFTGSYGRIQQHFSDILKVAGRVDKVGDRMWREADKLLTFPEVEGICIGYSKGTRGSGMGSGLRAQLLESVVQIVRAGTQDPAVFEIVGAFEDDIGPDRISDMVAKIIIPDLISFTQRVCSDLGIPMEPTKFSKWHPEDDLPINPVTGKALILVPKEILRDLPVANTYADIQWISAQNQELRKRFNDLVGSTWRDVTTSQKKEILKDCFIERPDVLAMVLEAYAGTARQLYNFDSDPSGEVVWYRAARTVAKEVPLKLEMPKDPAKEDVETVVWAICEHFKYLVEDNQLARLLYNDRERPKHESAAQLLFFGIASAYCQANNLDLTMESQAGRGPVDFKASRGFREKLLVEVKLTRNPKLVHGFEKQLPIYQQAEKAAKGVFLVLDNGGPESALPNLMKRVNEAGHAAPRVMIVDANLKPSASKA